MDKNPEMKSMLLQEATSARSRQNLKESEGVTLRPAAQYFHFSLISRLVLFPKTLHDQQINIYSCSGFVFGNLSALPRPPSFPARGCIPQTAD